MLRSDGPLSLYEFRSASRPQGSTIVFAFVVISIISTSLILSLRLVLETITIHPPGEQNKAHMLNYWETSTFNHGLCN